MVGTWILVLSVDLCVFQLFHVLLIVNIKEPGVRHEYAPLLPSVSVSITHAARLLRINTPRGVLPTDAVNHKACCPALSLTLVLFCWTAWDTLIELRYLWKRVSSMVHLKSVRTQISFSRRFTLRKGANDLSGLRISLSHAAWVGTILHLERSNSLNHRGQERGRTDRERIRKKVVASLTSALRWTQTGKGRDPKFCIIIFCLNLKRR